MGSHYFYWAMLALCCGYALWRGRGDERIAAAVCVAASLATHFILSPKFGGFRSFETGVLVIDVGVLGAFVTVALSSQRFWPLWVAGLQLTTSLAHLFRMTSVDLIPLAYAAAERFWSYPILLIIAFGAWRHHRRVKREAAFAAAA